MNLEGITLQQLTKELKTALEGGRIFKIFAPAKDSLLLLINRSNGTVNCLADFTGGSPLVYLPAKLPERPDIPSSFCMLLRKHLEEGRITLVEQTGLDRIITFHIDLIGANRQIITKHLILELTGKNSNIIFTDENNIILDSSRHIGRSQSSFRQILPGQPYTPPPAQEGLNFLTLSGQELISTLNTQPGSFVKKLVSATQGIGNNTAEEILARCKLPDTIETLNPQEFMSCGEAITALQSELATAQTCYGLINKRNVMKLVLPYKPVYTNGQEVRAFPSLLDALSYSAGLVPVQIPDKEQLTKIVDTALAKTKKKLKYLAQDLITAENAEQQKIIADTLMANIYQVEKGLSQTNLINIYDGQEMNIPLSPALSPVDNAQNYYKKYNKLKRALGEIKKQQEDTAQMLTYLESLEASLTTATTKGEIGEIKAEIIDLGLLAKPKKKTIGTEKSKPLELKLTADTTLFIGKNNKQNDFVTFKLGRGSDLWFHTKNIPGSHVILKTNLPAPEEKDILRAAELAAAFSKAKDSSKVPVDYTERRYVKKPNGAKPGFVIYTDQTTLYVTPKLPDKI